MDNLFSGFESARLQSGSSLKSSGETQFKCRPDTEPPSVPGASAVQRLSEADAGDEGRGKID